MYVSADWRHSVYCDSDPLGKLPNTFSDRNPCTFEYYILRNCNHLMPYFAAKLYASEIIQFVFSI